MTELHLVPARGKAVGGRLETMERLAILGVMDAKRQVLRKLEELRQAEKKYIEAMATIEDDLKAAWSRIVHRLDLDGRYGPDCYGMKADGTILLQGHEWSELDEASLEGGVEDGGGTDAETGEGDDHRGGD